LFELFHTAWIMLQLTEDCRHFHCHFILSYVALNKDIELNRKCWNHVYKEKYMAQVSILKILQYPKTLKNLGWINLKKDTSLLYIHFEKLSSISNPVTHMNYSED
jgi:hypothetical protein